jgi:hypothetical protein
LIKRLAKILSWVPLATGVIVAVPTSVLATAGNGCPDLTVPCVVGSLSAPGGIPVGTGVPGTIHNPPANNSSPAVPTTSGETAWGEATWDLPPMAKWDRALPSGLPAGLQVAHL